MLENNSRTMNRAILPILLVLSLTGCFGGGSGGSTTPPSEDTTPPSTPENLIVIVNSSTQINLVWDASTDNVAVVGYRVYRDGNLIVNNVTGVDYSDVALSPGIEYCYTVSSYDAAANESSHSIQACATTIPQVVIPLDTSDIRTYAQGDSLTATITARDIASGLSASGSVHITIGDSVKNPFGIDCRSVTYSGTLTGPAGTIPYSAKLLFHQDSSNSVYACGEYNESEGRYVFLTDTATSPNGILLERKSPVQLGNTTSGLIYLDDGTWQDCTQTVQAIENVSIPLGLFESYREYQTCSYSDGTTLINTVWIVPSIFNLKESGEIDGLAIEILVTNFSSSALDTTFGQGGIVIYDDDTSGFDEGALGLAIQTDGKIVVVGRAYNGLNDDVLIQRYKTDGSLDSGFATDGVFIFNSGRHEIAYAVAMTPDGKIVVAGYIDEFNAGNENILVMRLNSDGTLDNTFGTNGISTTNVSNYGEYGYALTIQPDGKLIVAGEVDVNGTDIQALILRYNTDGSLDGTFGNNGLFQYDDPANGWDIAYGVTLQEDGKIVATGSSSSQGALALTDILVLRLTNNGTLDDTFGNAGTIHYDDIYESGKTVLVQSNGKILIGGFKTNTTFTISTALIIRLNSDGTLDGTFGQSGIVEHTNATGKSLAISDDGKIVLLGNASSNVLVIRVTSDGSYDTTFNTDGIALISSGEFAFAQGKGVALQSDGSIIAAGRSTFHDQYSDSAVFLFKLTGQ